MKLDKHPGGCQQQHPSTDGPSSSLLTIPWSHAYSCRPMRSLLSDDQCCTVVGSDRLCCASNRQEEGAGAEQEGARYGV